MRKSIVIRSLIHLIICIGLLTEIVAQSNDPVAFVSNNEEALQSSLNRANDLLGSDLDSAIYLSEMVHKTAVEEELQVLEYQASKTLADAWYYKDSMLQAINYYKFAAEIIKELKGEVSDEYASRISDIGWCFQQLDIFDLAVENYNNALRIFTLLDNPIEISTQLNNLGTVYFRWGNFNQALDNFSKTLGYDQEHGDSIALSSSYNNIGKVYEAWGYYELAIDHYLKSIDFLGERGNESRRAVRLSNIGTSYYRNKDYDKALDYLYKALELDKRTKSKFKIAFRYNEIANVHAATGNYPKAIELNTESMQILQSLGRKESAAVVMKDLGNNFFESGDYLTAVDYYDQSIRVFRDVRSRSNEMAAYYKLAELYEKTGNFEQAGLNYRKYNALKDSIFNAQKHQQLANYRIRYETAKKERENQLLKKDILIKKRAQRTLMIIGALMLMSTILLIFLLRLKSKTIKQNRKLFEQEKKLAELELEKNNVEKKHLQDKVFAEQQLNRLQKEKFEAELQLKNKELVSSTLQLVNKNEVMSEIKKKINQYDFAIQENAYKDLIQLVNQNTDFDQNWKKISLEFEKTNPGFFDRIKGAYPDFSEQFIRLSAFLRMELSTKEIAQLMNVSVAAVNKNRQRLRKKLNLEPEADLTSFMKTI